MAKSELTGKRRMRGNCVSHSNIKTIRWQNVNVQRRRLWVPELDKFVSVRLTTRELRTIDKVGFFNFIKQNPYKAV